MQGTITSRITNFDHIISQTLQSEGVNIGVLARQCCESIQIDKRFPKKASNAIKEQLISISQNICQSFANTLSGLVESPDEKYLMEAVNVSTAEAVDQVMAQDFARCANQVLLRRRINSGELIQRILNQP